MPKDKFTILLALGIVIYFLIQFYKEYAKNKLVTDRAQREYDEYANTQYINMTKPHEYKDWEYTVNNFLDPANIFGFR